MNITSTTTVALPEWNTLHSKTQYFVHDRKIELSTGIVKRCIDYAMKRLALFPIDYSRIDKIHVEKNENEFYSVSFMSAGGSIVLGGIAVNAGGWPFIDHGVYVDINLTS